MANYPLRSLSEVIPAEHAPIALAWFAHQLHMTADQRDNALRVMARLGASGEVIAAYREATNDLRDLADRWEFELAGHAPRIPEQRKDNGE